MSCHWPPELALHSWIVFGESPPGDAQFNKLVVPSCRRRHGRLFPLDVISVCGGWDRSSGEALICGVDHLFAGDARSACFCSIVMEEKYRKKNRRMLIAILIFAIGFTVLIILWKLSIYQKS